MTVASPDVEGWQGWEKIEPTPGPPGFAYRMLLSVWAFFEGFSLLAFGFPTNLDNDPIFSPFRALLVTVSSFAIASSLTVAYTHFSNRCPNCGKGRAGVLVAKKETTGEKRFSSGADTHLVEDGGHWETLGSRGTGDYNSDYESKGWIQDYKTVATGLTSYTMETQTNTIEYLKCRYCGKSWNRESESWSSTSIALPAKNLSNEQVEERIRRLRQLKE